MLLTALLLAAAAFAAPPRPPKPPILSRAAWKAELPARMAQDKAKWRFVLHHTAYPVTDEVKKLTGKASWQAAQKHARSAQHLHRHIRGWNDVGYHYLIDWEGRILEGRPLDRLGAHVERHNTGSVGIVLMGDFSRQKPTAKQLAAAKDLLRWLSWELKLSPKHIAGHHHMKFTACPGKHLNDPWDPKSPLQALRTELLVEYLNSQGDARTANYP
jgi:N-acetyl-anhydromuramyl-L-alanine amidase AmpD